jgi:hypothetical protein
MAPAAPVTVTVLGMAQNLSVPNACRVVAQPSVASASLSVALGRMAASARAGSGR